MDAQKLMNSELFQSLLQEVQLEFARITKRPSRRSALEAEKRELEEQSAGWLQSLGNPKLSSNIRTKLESELANTADRLQQIDADLDAESAFDQQQLQAVEPDAVVHELKQLAEVLAADEVSRANVELSLHIDHIRCDKDGKVAVRTCKLGLLPDVRALLQQNSETPTDDGEVVEQPTSSTRIKPRLRSKLHLVSEPGRGRELADDMEFALNPNRFAGLPDKWFWVDEIQMPKIQCWSEQNADAVYQRHQETGMSQKQLAEEFGVSIPTIRKALKIAKQRQS